MNAWVPSMRGDGAVPVSHGGGRGEHGRPAAAEAPQEDDPPDARVEREAADGASERRDAFAFVQAVDGLQQRHRVGDGQQVRRVQCLQ